MAVPGTNQDVMDAFRAALDRAAQVRQATQAAAQQLYQQSPAPPPPAGPGRPA